MNKSASVAQTPPKWHAQWIWNDGPDAPRNFYLAARRELTVQDNSENTSWRLHVTADTRCRVYVNGTWIGDGPARGFAWNWQFDTYDLTGLVNEGTNVIAIVAQHWGEGTMKYKPSGRAGILAQLEKFVDNEWRYVDGTDENWQVCTHTGFIRPMPRMALQMPFVEAYDARAFSDDWLKQGGGEGFTAATVIGPVGCAPWTHLEKRPTPPLTRIPVMPERISRMRLTCPANHHFGFNLTPYIRCTESATQEELRGFVACIISSPSEQTIRIWALDYFDWQENPFVNGVETQNDMPVQLHKGDNLFVCACLPGHRNVFDRSYAAMTDTDIEVRGVFQTESPYTIFGPIDNWADERARVITARTADDLESWREYAQPITPEDVYSHGTPWAETTVSKTLPGTPQICNAENMYNDSTEYATIHPSEDGDPEITLDFGKVSVGWLEIDIAAPSGVTLDFNCYEAIEDGKIHYTEGNQNGMRYITRDGRQKYVSHMRRGCRYVQITARDLSQPIHIYSMRLYFSTHPLSARGAFACSDELLNRIWHVGRYTLQCCSEDTYTDCPTYEQGYWVGDARNEALIDYASCGNIALPQRCIALAAESLECTDIPQCCIPQEGLNLLPAWSMLWVQMVEEQWQFTSDKEWLVKTYPAVHSTLRACREKYTDENGLFSILAWNMFDWAGMDSGHKCVAHNNMFLAEAYRRAAILADALKNNNDAEWYRTQRAELITAINTHLWNEEKQAYHDSIHDDGSLSPVISQQNNSLALLYDIVPATHRDALCALVKNPPEEYVHVGSPFALFFILDALAHEKKYKDVLHIIRTRWNEMLRKGATTFWEVFPGFEKDWWTRSHCHAWSAAPVYFLTKYLLGVWWEEPGYTTARIEPITLDIDWAEGRVPTPHGAIEIAWEKTAEVFTLSVALPQGVSAEVILPEGAEKYTDIKVVDGKIEKRDNKIHIALSDGSQTTVTAHCVD